MNQHLTLTRSKMVFSKYWFENKRVLLLLFGAVGVFLTILMSLYYSFRTPNLFTVRFQIAYYFAGLFIAGPLTASFLFADLRSKARAINYLMVPASQLEKVICVMFFGVIVFWVGYSIVFTCIDWVFVSLSNARSRRTEAVINILFINRYQNPFLESPSSSLYYIYFAVHALFLLGSVYFSRYAFFKSLLVLLFFWMILVTLPIFIHGFLPPGEWINSVSKYEVFDYREAIVLSLPSWFSTSLYLFFCYGVTISIWVAAYFRFTERQVA